MEEETVSNDSASANATFNRGGKYENTRKLKNIPPMPTFPSLYNYELEDVAVDSEFLTDANSQSKCLLLASKFKMRQKLLSDYGWERWIMPPYETSVVQGWKPEEGWQDKDLQMQGRVDCIETCHNITGSLTGIRWIEKGQTTGPATKCKEMIISGQYEGTRYSTFTFDVF